MKHARVILCCALVAFLAGCGLKRNLTLPKTPPGTSAQAQGQAGVNPGPAPTTAAPAGNTPANAAAPATPVTSEAPPSTSFMIQPQVTQPLSPAMLSAPTR